MPSTDAIKVEIIKTQGSTPRDVGTCLYVGENFIQGSIGGGALEYMAVAKARTMLVANIPQDETRFTLGPASAQCCGGIVTLLFTKSPRPKLAPPRLAIFGAGHVGVVLARIARALSWEVDLYDTRPKIEIASPEDYTLTPIPEYTLGLLPAGTHIVIMTHDHGLDFLLARAALDRPDLGFLGMIGSKTKAARFKHIISDPKISNRLHCPIGKSGKDKRPETIALEILLKMQSCTDEF